VTIKGPKSPTSGSFHLLPALPRDLLATRRPLLSAQPSRLDAATQRIPEFYPLPSSQPDKRQRCQPKPNCSAKMLGPCWGSGCSTPQGSANCRSRLASPAVNTPLPLPLFDRRRTRSETSSQGLPAPLAQRSGSLRRGWPLEIRSGNNRAFLAGGAADLECIASGHVVSACLGLSSVHRWAAQQFME
jgi:hypothetical protein